jgi:2-oxoglutarate/2-oxoacid ferredoxin oxidoreductase subunit alpha
LSIDFALKIGGLTGEGIFSAGDILASAVNRFGLYLQTFRSFPSVIKGGHTCYEIRMSSKPVLARADWIDVLVALDQGTLDLHISELRSGHSFILYDSKFNLPANVSGGTKSFAIPFEDIAKVSGSKQMSNTVALGASALVLGLPLSPLEQTVAALFQKKGQSVLKGNIEALQAGHSFMLEKLAGVSMQLEPSTSGNALISGNEALAYGALRAGCRVYASYPITPATDILGILAEKMPEVGGAVVQTEDEIAAISIAIGANYAGTRAMTATSGPGISLMTEAFGLAGMTETPVVILDEQRPGPSAGQPTKHEQGDLKHLVYSSHGEFPRIVLTPGTAEECYSDIALAFNLADLYQCPVFVAVDQDLVLKKKSVRLGDLKQPEIQRNILTSKSEIPNGKEYVRFENTPSGIQKRSIPSVEGLVFLASGDEHDEDGSIDVEDPSVRRKMVEKRMKKVRPDDLFKNIRGLVPHGDEKAENVIVSYGSTLGPLIEAMDRLKQADSISTKFVQIRCAWPLPSRELKSHFKGAKRIAVVEHNSQGQLANLIKQEIGYHNKIRNITKYDGEPYRVREVYSDLKDVFAN